MSENIWEDWLHFFNTVFRLFSVASNPQKHIVLVNNFQCIDVEFQLE